MVDSSSPNQLPVKPIKFICSYGGRILPRYPDGKLRYHGGETRVLAVDRSISCSELLLKLGGMCGTAVNLRCQFPAEDLDALVSITSDEDLANLIEEYDCFAADPPSVKIRAFLSAPKMAKKSPSPPSSASSSSSGSISPKSPLRVSTPRCPSPGNGLGVHHASKPPRYPNAGVKVSFNYLYPFQFRQHGHGNGGGSVYVIPNGSHSQ